MKDKRFEDLENMVYLDIDRPYFIKPQYHPIFYRLSSSKCGFHVAFKKEWLTGEEFFLMLRQCDHDWLCQCIVDEHFRIAKTKNGKSATDWRLSFHVTESGLLQSHTKKILEALNKYPKMNVAIVHYEKIEAKLKKSLKQKGLEIEL